MKSLHALLFAILFGGPLGVASAQPKADAKADPAASKLLAEARKARAIWENFPGFTADLEVNIEGKVLRGQLHVNANGKVRLDKLEKEAAAWASQVLGSITNHRLDSGERDTPCAFADTEEHHPLGRSIRVLGDGMHSGFRIRDNQVMVVDRRMKTSRFTISVLENRTNAEGKYLPISYVVNHWDLITGQLTRSDATFQTWTRVGRFDLPTTARTVSASRATPKAHTLGQLGAEAYSVRSLTLSNHKLLAAESR